MIFDVKYRSHTFPEKIFMKIAWMLPHEITKWAFIRVMAHATTGPNSHRHPEEVTYSDAYKSWESKACRG